MQAENLFISNGGSFRYLLPCMIDPGVNGEAFYPLAAQDLFLNQNSLCGNFFFPMHFNGGAARFVGREIIGCIRLPAAGYIMIGRGGGGREPGAIQEIFAIAAPDICPQFLQPGRVIFVKEAFTGWGNIQQKRGVSAYGFFVDINELFQRMNLMIFLWMPEPARADRGIHFGGIPDQFLLILQNFPAAQILILGPDDALAKI